MSIIFFALAIFTAGIALGAFLENKRWLKNSIRNTLSDDEKTRLIRDLSEGQLKRPPGCTYLGSSDIYREIRELMDKASQIEAAAADRSLIRGLRSYRKKEISNA